MTPHHTPTSVVASGTRTLPFLLACAVGLSGCSVLQEDKVDYKSAKRVSTLEVPPDLTQLSADTRYAMPNKSVVTASGHQVAAPSSTSKITATSEVGDVRIERAGTRHRVSARRRCGRRGFCWKRLSSTGSAKPV